jgi:hypothetical protein
MLIAKSEKNNNTGYGPSGIGIGRGIVASDSDNGELGSPTFL